MDVHENDIW